MHERDNKHHGHYCQFGKDTRPSQPYLLMDTAVDEDSIPFVTFQYRYRPEDTLHNLGVIHNKKRRKAEHPPRRSERIHVMAKGGGVADLEVSGNDTSSRTRRVAKQGPQDDQLLPQSPYRAQVGSKPRDWPMEEGPDAEAEENAARPSERNNFREPTLDYWNIPQEDAQVVVPPIYYFTSLGSRRAGASGGYWIM
ncbi:hypothetical protein L226DRAFT_189158 [Lentinus tigrinus ALCF2SS1-7]|uniref:Uncharacterized protein n=1 Tax=Lentinus tigrinus ALCF2SS1-6 TaxID=1328759 RepID=A0A5C2SQK0_9APHY|nr:hypothetical protein L227DRAFT_133055 [Lentinus tigrinus ALCF2SS1-6]RPD80046.1 hypothetical protein L226DRAFT_189158 [Lentinus tigrinus ALCF2SS1-7]